MILKKLELDSFRNYEKEVFRFSDSINVIYGDNGQGKTNLLEAIYFLAFTQGFRNKKDSDCLNKSTQAKFFDIRASFENRFESEEKTRLFFSLDDGKHIFFNGNKEKKYKDHIGKIPLVLLKPDDIKLLFGAPKERRQFIDVLLSQISISYMTNLMHLKRVLKQKNATLSQYEINYDMLLSWNKKLAEYSFFIIQKRYEAIMALNALVQEYYPTISAQNDDAEIVYQTSLAENTANISLEEIESTLQKNLEREIKQKRSLIGPQRDEILFKLNGKLVSEFGSQGENKTFLLSLKFAELHYLRTYSDENPIMLFDDIFSELDKKRIRRLLELITGFGQIFITTTEKDIYSNKTVKKNSAQRGKTCTNGLN